jgi:hypothetical protein
VHESKDIVPELWKSEYESRRRGKCQVRGCNRFNKVDFVYIINEISPLTYVRLFNSNVYTDYNLDSSLPFSPQHPPREADASLEAILIHNTKGGTHSVRFFWKKFNTHNIILTGSAGMIGKSSMCGECIRPNCR